MNMGKKLRGRIYRMKEQGFDTTEIHEVVEAEMRRPTPDPEEVVWDDEAFLADEDDDHVDASGSAFRFRADGASHRVNDRNGRGFQSG
jgi:hypothetical protein